jgi:hypothetical protein
MTDYILDIIIVNSIISYHDYNYHHYVRPIIIISSSSNWPYLAVVKHLNKLIELSWIIFILTFIIAIIITITNNSVGPVKVDGYETFLCWTVGYNLLQHYLCKSHWKYKIYKTSL